MVSMGGPSLAERRRSLREIRREVFAEDRPTRQLPASIVIHLLNPKMMNKLKKALGDAKDSAGRNINYAKGKSSGFTHPEAVEPHIIVRRRGSFPSSFCLSLPPCDHLFLRLCFLLLMSPHSLLCPPLKYRF